MVERLTSRGATRLNSQINVLQMEGQLLIFDGNNRFNAMAAIRNDGVLGLFCAHCLG